MTKNELLDKINGKADAEDLSNLHSTVSDNKASADASISNLSSSLANKVDKEKYNEVANNVAKLNKDINEFKEAIIDQVENYKPIVINGNVTNAADEEDITSDGNLLKLKDRTALNGMGYAILRKNKTFAEQVTKTNTIYEIRYGHEVGGTESSPIVIPNNCILRFCGGYLKDGYINLDNCLIEADAYQIFDESLAIKSDRVVSAFIGLPEWFGAKADGESDNTIPMQKCIDTFEKTELTGRKYKITDVYLNAIGRPFGRKLLNRSIVCSYGNGICLDSYSEFFGGEIHVSPNAVGITVGKEDDETAHPRISVHDVKIIDNSDNNTYGIKCVAKEGGGHYNDFAFIGNVHIYGCFHGFYGNMRSSFIEVAIEGCKDNFHGTDFSLNNVFIVGQSSTMHEDYPYFITIVGDQNIINAQVYDVGVGDFQKYLINIDGIKNKINGDSEITYIGDSEASNSSSKPYNKYDILKIHNPIYEVVTNSVTTYPTTELDRLKSDAFRDNSLPIELWMSEETSYVEFQFGKVLGFAGIRFVFSAANAAFQKIEVRRNASDALPFKTIYNKNSSVMINVSANSYKEFWNYLDGDNSFLPQWNDNLSVRCYSSQTVRFIRAELFAINAPTLKAAGDTSSRPTNYAPIGFQYYDTTLSKPIWRNGSGWVDATGADV